MSNTYLKLTFSKLRFSKLKNLWLGQFLGSSNSSRYHWIYKILVAVWLSEVWEQNCVWLCSYFNFERNYDVSKSKNPCILLNKNINLNKNERERRTLCFSSYKNRKLKVKLWWVGGSERKKEDIFCTAYFVRRKFLTFTFYLNI